MKQRERTELYLIDTTPMPDLSLTFHVIGTISGSSIFQKEVVVVDVAEWNSKIAAIRRSHVQHVRLNARIRVSFLCTLFPEETVIISTPICSWRDSRKISSLKILRSQKSTTEHCQNKCIQTPIYCGSSKFLIVKYRSLYNTAEEFDNQNINSNVRWLELTILFLAAYMCRAIRFLAE